MTRLNLDALNKECLDEIRKTFLNIPLSETQVEFVGTFHSKNILEPNLVTKGFSYIPKQVNTAIFRGKYIYEKDSYQDNGDSSPLQNVSDTDRTISYYSRSLGNLVAEYVSALPDSISNLFLIFSTNDEYEQGYSKVSTDLQQICKALANSITHLNIKGIIPKIHPSNLPPILQAMPSSLVALNMDKAVLANCSPSTHRAIFMAMNPKLNHLSLAHCNLNQLTSITFLAFFNGLNSQLKSINLGFNQLAKKPIGELSVFFSHLPQQLISLLLAGNEFSSLDWVSLAQVLINAPKTLKHIDLSDNQLLFKPLKDLHGILHSLYFNISSIRICEEDTARLPLIELIERFRVCFPEHIDSLSFSHCNLLGRSMTEFAECISKLPEHFKVLDFSHNDLSKKSIEELICLFSNIPKHIKKIKLSHNGLCAMDRASLHEIFSLLPKHIEIDVSDNGFETLAFGQLNQLADALPDGLIQFGKSRLRLKNNGSLVCVPNANGLFKSELKLRHQKEFAMLQLSLVQLVQSSPLSFDILELLLPFLFPSTLSDVYRMMKQMSLTNSYLPAKKVSLNYVAQRQSYKAFQFRINALAPNEKSLNLGHCALNRLNSKMLIALFNSLTKTALLKLRLNANGFLNSEWSKRNLFTALKHLPPQFEFLDLSENGFENLDWGELKQFLLELPKTLRYISLNHEKPISPQEQIDQRDIPDYYYDLTKNVSNPLQQAVILLEDYSKGDSLLKRFLTLHWKRSHSAEVTQLVFLIQYGMRSNIEDLLVEMEHIPKNASGSLGKRLMFLNSMKQDLDKTKTASLDECKFPPKF